MAFALPTLLAIAITVYLSARGLLSSAAQLGPLGWLLAIVLVDVAHVYATIYRVYANPLELRRRPALYLLVPLAAYAGGVLLHAHDSLTFWRALAYLAVFHFVRQQYGFVALCGRKERYFSLLDRRLDAVAVYAGTLYPLFYWHTHLPRRFSWFIDGDFFSPSGTLPPFLPRLIGLFYVAIFGLWLLRQLQRVFFLPQRSLNVPRVLVMLSTWSAWYLGIVHYDNDIAFTLTNVLPHGIPYFVLLYRYRRNRIPMPLKDCAGEELPRSPLTAVLLFYLPLSLFAFTEEGIWDRLVFHDHRMLFPGPEVFVSAPMLCFLVPLLALPQATHYLLDAWIWKIGPQNPHLRQELRL